MPINTSSSDEGVTGAAKFVTSTVGVSLSNKIAPSSLDALSDLVVHFHPLSPRTSNAENAGSRFVSFRFLALCSLLLYSTLRSIFTFPGAHY
jgi:hypothetical protein